MLLPTFEDVDLREVSSGANPDKSVRNGLFLRFPSRLFIQHGRLLSAAELRPCSPRCIPRCKDNAGWLAGLLAVVV